ncbi:hypothetical protein, partial [Paraburkholderia domus]|uniref:hypothetical protein n=1 Tax=Paraburkholderia domus TaxID=2793075 RepID=UPI001B8AA221
FEFERVLRPLCLDRHRFFSLLEFTHSARDSFFGGKVSLPYGVPDGWDIPFMFIYAKARRRPGCVAAARHQTVAAR